MEVILLEQKLHKAVELARKRLGANKKNPRQIRQILNSTAIGGEKNRKRKSIFTPRRKPLHLWQG